MLENTENQKWTIQKNWHHRVHKTKTTKTRTQHNTICVGQYAYANKLKYNVNWE